MKLIIGLILIFTCCFASAINQSYENTLTQFYELAKKLEEKKTLPTLDMVEGKKILNQLTDPMLLVSLSKNKLSEDINIMENLKNVYAYYLSFNPEKKARLSLIDLTRNIKQFEPEIILITSFNIEYFSALLPIINEFYEQLPEAEKTDIRLSGAKQMQLGILQSYTGVLMWVSTPDCLSDHSKQQLISTIEKTTKNSARFLSEKKKKEIISLVEIVVAKQPKYNSQFTNIIKMIEESPCEYLCQVTSE
ncbi:hypothetical protein [Gilliamella sp. wkB112]|uniref:hypothetical protein n=1 Tax=Gilliamella sp. wkB112 TaxID=3120257 RepID=UPI00080E06C4|nr:hypothetical protein [Gilliamella apicola]OCG03025.1 hypothetical protein A9G12_08890 [Gilliamella apicola]